MQFWHKLASKKRSARDPRFLRGAELEELEEKDRELELRVREPGLRVGREELVADRSERLRLDVEHLQVLDYLKFENRFEVRKYFIIAQNF